MHLKVRLWQQRRILQHAGGKSVCNFLVSERLDRCRQDSWEAIEARRHVVGQLVETIQQPVLGSPQRNDR